MSPILSSRAAAAIAVLIAALASLPAQAQSMDYGALEQTFGEPVTTSATGSPQRATDAPVDMIIVTADEIRRSGAHDIPGVLRHVAGVDVEQWTNADSDVGVRGYDQPYSPRLLVLIDGRQVYADYYGFTPWSALPVELSEIRQIEIVKGPNTALFGFNAVGGVINIVTYNPQYDDTNTVTFAAGTQSLGEGSAVLTVRDGSTAALRASVGGRIDDDFDTPIPAAVSGPQRKNEYRFEADLDGVVRLAEGVELGLEASHSVAAQNEIFPGLTVTNSVFDTDSVKAELSADTAYGLFKLTAYTNWIIQRANFALAGIPVQLNLGNRVSVAQLEDNFTFGADNTIRLAAEYRHNGAGTTLFTGATVSYDVYSGSAMWAWSITPSLALTNAVRFDDLQLDRTGAMPPFAPFTNADWTRTINEASYNSGLVWRVGDADTLRLLASRGAQLPNLTNLGAVLIFAPPLLAVSGSPFLQPTIVQNYEIGWDHAFDAFAAKLRVSAFHQDTQGIVSDSGNFIPTLLGTWVVAAQAGNSHADGAELAIDGTFDEGWRWGANYRWETVRDKFLPFARGSADYLDYQHTTPAHVVNLSLGWGDDRWELDGYLHDQSKTFGLVPGGVTSFTVLQPIPSYVSLDARIAYRLSDKVTLALSGQNLGLSQQRQTTAPDVERRVLFTVTAGL